MVENPKKLFEIQPMSGTGDTELKANNHCTN